MDKHAIQELYEQESSYWWHKGRRIVMESLLDKAIGKGAGLKILDVGCGTGANLTLFRKFGKVSGVDASLEAVEYCRQRGFKDIAQGRAEVLSFPDRAFDMVTAVELLEHMKNDEEVLKEFSRVLKSEGKLFLTVPAYQFLWTEHDEALEHVKRYTLGELKEKIMRAGFEIEKGTYMVTFTSPLFIYRVFKELFRRKEKPSKTSYVTLPKFLNTILVYPFVWEAQILRYANLPFGTSVLCIARKREGL